MAIRKENIQIFDVAVPPPYVNKTTNTWWLYNAEAEKYEDSKMKAVGVDGLSARENILSFNRIEASENENKIVEKIRVDGIDKLKWTQITAATSPLFLSVSLKQGKTYVFSCYTDDIEYCRRYMHSDVALGGIAYSNDTVIGDRWYFPFKAQADSDVLYFYGSNPTNNGDGTLSARTAHFWGLKVEEVAEGEKALPTAFMPHSGDIQSRIDAEKKRIDEILNDNIADPSEKQYLKQKWAEINGEFQALLDKARSIEVDDRNFEFSKGELEAKLTPIIADLTVSTEINGEELRILFTNYYREKANLQNAISQKLADKVEKKVNEISAKQLALEYIEKAIKQEAEIEGALVTLVTMLLKENMDAEVTAGISGIQGVNKDAPAVWGGGTYEDAIANVADWVLRHDGTGQLAGGMMWWTKDGKLYIGKKGTNKLIMLSSETLADIDSSTQTADVVIADYEDVKYAHPTSSNQNVITNNSKTIVFNLEYDAFLSGNFDIIVELSSPGAINWGADGRIILFDVANNRELETVFVEQLTDTWEANLILTDRFLPKGKYEVRIGVDAGGEYGSGTPRIDLFIGCYDMRYKYDVKKVLIGLDGITIKDSMSTNYINLSLNNQDIIDVRGNVKFKSQNAQHQLAITDTGIRKSNNSGASWVNL